jgi:hypothetical protein
MKYFWKFWKQCYLKFLEIIWVEIIWVENYKSRNYMSWNYMSWKIIRVEIIWVEIIWNAIIWVEIIWNVTEPFFLNTIKLPLVYNLFDNLALTSQTPWAQCSPLQEINLKRVYPTSSLTWQV